MGTFSGIAILGVIGLAYLLYKQVNKRLDDALEDMEITEGVIDVRRRAEEAKHNDPDAIKRVRDKYNS